MSSVNAITSKPKAPSPNAFFIMLLRLLLKPILIRQYNVESHFDFDISLLKPPYIVISNHVNFWDPFFINLFIPDIIQFVTSDNIFRTKFFGLVMRLVGSVPKTKFRRDMDAVRAIFRIIKRPGVIGIFPEARRSWTGTSFTVMPEVVRLVARLKLPILSVRICGGYLSKPRWATSMRHGKVTLEYRMLLSKNDDRYGDGEKLYETLQDAVKHDDVAYAMESTNGFKGNNLAEYLERVLFLCPECDSLSSLRSKGNRLTCTSCTLVAHYNEFGQLAADPATHLPFGTVHEWDVWQRERLEKLVVERAKNKDESDFFPPEEAELRRCKRTEPMQLVSRGMASLSPRGIRFAHVGGEATFFPLSEIAGANVQNGEKLEFYHQSHIMRIDLPNERSCTYKWFRAIGYLRSFNGYRDGTF